MIMRIICIIIRQSLNWFFPPITLGEARPMSALSELILIKDWEIIREIACNWATPDRDPDADEDGEDGTDTHPEPPTDKILTDCFVPNQTPNRKYGL